jgi:hypothetical protein
MPRETEKYSGKTSVSTAGVPAKIQTGPVPHSSYKRYGMSHLAKSFIVGKC